MNRFGNYITRATPQKTPENENPSSAATTKSNSKMSDIGIQSAPNTASIMKCDIPPWFGESAATPTVQSTKKSALLTALNCVYDSVDSNDSAESLIADAVRKADTPDSVRLLRALTFATNDLDFESELYNNWSDFISRIPTRFFEHQSAAKGVNVSEVRKMHNRQLLLQESFDRDFDHDLWDELTAKCEHENRHHSPTSAGTDSKSNTPNSNRNLPYTTGECGDEYAGRTISSPLSSCMKPLPIVRAESLQNPPKPSIQHIMQQKLTIQNKTGAQPPPLLSSIQQQKPTQKLERERNDRTNMPIGLSRKISCPQINFDSRTGEPDGKTVYSPAALPESGTQYLALVGSLLSELSPESELNQMYFIEIALVSSIQSLKLSLDFYRYFMFHSGSQKRPTGDDDAHANTNDRLYLQNLYLDTLEVETMLYDCLDRFRHDKGRAFATKHIQKLQKAVKKMNDIQDSLHRITSSSSISTTFDSAADKFKSKIEPK